MSDQLLPEDIQVEILLRLPVKSLISFKCVCKQWCSLISDPTFIKNHLNRGIQTNNVRLLVKYYDGWVRSGIASKALTSLQSLSYDGYRSEKYPLQDSRDWWFETLGSSHGLICLLVIGGHHENKNTICIWNPSTREYKQVPLFIKSIFDKTIYGFGYDGVNDDYKLVRIYGTKNSGHLNIEVYSLRSDSWSNNMQIPYRFTSPTRCNGLLFNGALHWFGVVKDSSIEVIVSFHLSNERIVEIPLPHSRRYEGTSLISLLEECPLRKNSMGTSLGLLEDCLCSVYTDLDRKTIDVWVMKDYGVTESWTKQFTIDIQDRDIESRTIDVLWMPVCAFENGDILANTASKRSVIYNPKKVGHRVAFMSGDRTKAIWHAASYVESLVSLKTGTYTGVKTFLWMPEKKTNVLKMTEKKTRNGKRRFLKFMKKTTFCYC